MDAEIDIQLLSTEELRRVREPDPSQADANFRLLVIRTTGLEDLYRSNPHVHQSLLLYVRGVMSLRGAKLVAARSLSMKYVALLDLLEEHCAHGPWQVLETYRLENISSSNLCYAAAVTEEMQSYAARILNSRSGPWCFVPPQR